LSKPAAFGEKGRRNLRKKLVNPRQETGATWPGSLTERKRGDILKLGAGERTHGSTTPRSNQGVAVQNEVPSEAEKKDVRKNAFKWLQLSKSQQKERRDAGGKLLSSWEPHKAKKASTKRTDIREDRRPGSPPLWGIKGYGLELGSTQGSMRADPSIKKNASSGGGKKSLKKTGSQRKSLTKGKLKPGQKNTRDLPDNVTKEDDEVGRGRRKGQRLRGQGILYVFWHRRPEVDLIQNCIKG